ncbi:MAG: hypothetical protein ABSE06_20715 [Anaerolineaceae bacterium]|jgi:hypothetical protein
MENDQKIKPDRPTGEKPRPALSGSHVDLELIDASGGREALSFDIVPDKLADFKNGFLGEKTPLAQAISGRIAGEHVTYRVDEIVEIHILDVQRSQASPDKGIEARRQAALRKAVRQSDLTNAVLFASSFNGKWGDYDPTGLTEEMDEEQP